MKVLKKQQKDYKLLILNTFLCVGIIYLLCLDFYKLALIGFVYLLIKNNSLIKEKFDDYLVQKGRLNKYYKKRFPILFYVFPIIGILSGLGMFYTGYLLNDIFQMEYVPEPYLYFNAGAYVQTILLGKEIMEQKPDNKEVLELVAVSEQNLGAQKEALEHYEQLYQLTQSPFHLYQIASLQYSLKRYGECEMSVNRILADPAAGEEMVGITIGKGQTQKVPLKAAAYNMKGVIAMDLSKNDIAKNNFEEALEIFPEFQLASLNLKSLTEGESGEMTDKEEAKD